MAADFDEPVFDEDFVRSAVFTEPSARERARPPSRRERRRSRRAARRSAGRRFALRRRDHEPSPRAAVLQVIGGVLVLLAISFALWWWNSAPRDERPARPVGPTVTRSPAPAPTPTAPEKDAPPTEIPEV
ncbi:MULTISPECIES: SCO2583/SCO2584 N-terminal domain-containing protein [Actinomadura]|jgi:hypothetical protein|uniref:Uncharacterized protein n=1 Tax=Actinomadura citrea TaxID=46158 RepID=A0A7Y9GB63_9ACTN|nr:hypothetical protein [Actinomadura citrea]NYE11885.1 hypothetical protein [Actinomadura citrea]GGT90661.1 hypothetical protein GCM10010177_57340 [Actinomadura citrea]